MTALANLLPCPFCGGSDLFGTSNGLNSSFIECNTCGASGPVYDDEDSDVAAWNRRATLSPAELGGGEPDAWLVESERAGKVSAELWEVAADDVIADVVKEYGDAYGATTKRPLYSTPRADEAVVDDAMVERLAKYIYQQEAWKAGFSLDESLRHQAYWARAIPEARKMLTAALSPPSPGAAK